MMNLLDNVILKLLFLALYIIYSTDNIYVRLFLLSILLFCVGFRIITLNVNILNTMFKKMYMPLSIYIFITIFLIPIVNYNSYLSYNYVLLLFLINGAIIIYLISLLVVTNYSKNIIDQLFSGLLIYVFINVLLFLVGIEKNVDFTYSRRSYWFFESRIFFALAPGVNSFGIICGFLASYYLGKIPKNKIKNLIKISVPIFGAIATENRGSIILFLIFALLTIIKAHSIFANRISLIGIIMMPFIYLKYVWGSIGISLLSSRENIWSAIIDNYEILKSHLFWGFGMNGHISSGLSKTYSIYFSNINRENTLLLHSHNLFLQILIDHGVIAFGCIVIVLLKMFKNSILDKSILFILYYITIIGAIDLTITLNNFYLFFPTLCIMVIYTRKQEANFVQV
jgi:hypothetical protein